MQVALIEMKKYIGDCRKTLLREGYIQSRQHLTFGYSNQPKNTHYMHYGSRSVMAYGPELE